MKEFDFVKLTLWIAVVLTAALGGGYVWLGTKVAQLQLEIREVESIARRVGSVSKDISALEEQKRNDKTPDASVQAGIYSYFANIARPFGIDANSDYTLRPRDADKNRDNTYVDTPYVLDFKRDRPKTRDTIMKFIFNVESAARRIKLAKAKLTLVEAKADDDLWIADSLTFIQRDLAKK
jgi:hypothetical protein